jgi:ATP-binding cassette, subfamily B, bacterial
MSQSANGSGNGNGNGRAGAAKRATVYDIVTPINRRGQLRRIPQLTHSAVGLVWEASRRHLITTVLLQVVSGAVIGAQLLVARRLLTELITISESDGSISGVAPEFVLLIVLMVVIGAIAALTAHQQRLLTELVGRRAFDQIISVSSAVELDSFENPRFYDQLQRARISGMSRPIEMVTSLVTLTTGITTSIGIGFALFVIEPLLVVLVAVAGIPLMLATLYNSGQAYQFEYGMTPNARERAYLMELLTGRDSAKEVRAFGSQRFLRKRYDALTDERIDRLRIFLKQRLVVAMVGTLGTSLGTAAALVSLAVLLVNGDIGIADAVTAGAAMPLLAARITAMTGSIGKLVEAGMFLDDYSKFLELAPIENGHEPEPARPRPPKRGLGSLSVENVSFVYPNTDTPVLDDVSLRIDPGEVVALVGENGSGKTTLVKLICQLYHAQQGRVLWNGVDASTLSSEDMQDDMTVIFQDYVQYHLSARDNISLGRVGRAPELADVQAAAMQAGAHELVSTLPLGYDTRLGRQFYGGHELSIGQWQRIALARAFFRGGSFLVLDEPTASLDPKAEHELFEQMRGLSAGKSVLLVSHRFSSVRSADRIYVLEGGRVTESGSHEELVELDGHYADLFRLQAAAYL